MKKIFSLFAALTLSVGLWAETVITYTASQKLGDKLWSQLLGTYQHEFVGNNGTITIQGELSTIPEKVFSKSTYLQTIILPECVTSIGENAFLMCSSLQSIAMPKVTTIEHDAFKNCGSLSSIELPNVTTIGRQAFSLCTSLLSIELPKVVSIEHSAFLGSALQSVTFLSTSCTIDDFAFEGVGSAAKPATLVLPDNWTGTKPAQDGSWYGGYFTMPVSTTYLDENGEEQTVDAWEVKDASAAVTWGTAGDTTWFVVKGEDVQLSAGAICAGDVRLILADNAQLTAQGASSFPTGYAGIQVSGEGNSLTIYGQSTGDEMGQLIAYGGYYSAGIGGGIGGSGSNIIINGGKVTANGEESTAGIGGGMNGSGSNITINGGIVEATGMGAGIGGGIGGSGFDIYISDAYVLKAGGYAEDTEVIAHSSAQDLGSTLTQNYVKIEGLAMPYTRTTSVDQWATVCLPYDATSFSGADFYKVNYYDASNPSDLKLYIEPVDNLEAGMPYIFHTTATTVTIYHNATAPEAVTAGNENGLYGSFARKTIDYDADHAYAAIAGGAVNVIEEGYTVTVPACRAYLDMDQVPTVEQPHSAPLRCIGVPRQNPTGLGQWNKDKGQKTYKVIENGQFVIIKDNKMYNAQGIEL